MKKINRKGFTLVETLTVIVILGLIMTIAVSSVTKYITTSKKKTLVQTIASYIDEIKLQVNNREYNMRAKNTIYAIPIECIKLEGGGNNPFGEWIQSNDQYWAYVLVQYDSEKFEHKFGFSFKDSAGYGMYPLINTKIEVDGDQIQQDLFLSRPKTGIYTLMTTQQVWSKSGFNVNSLTRLKVLSSTLEGEKGDNKTTCTLIQRGSNYGEVENKVNTDYGSFEANVPTYTTDSTNCTYETCYSDNGGQLEYDELGGIVLDNNNAVAILTEENAAPIDDEFTIHLTFKGPINQTPAAGGYAGTIVAIANKQSNNFLAWIGVYKKHLHVYTFTKSSHYNINYSNTVTGFASIPLDSKYDNKIMNVQVTSKKGNQTKVYINGTLARTFTSGNENINVAQTTVGDLRPYRNLKYTGVLYEIEIYDRVISQSEINSNWEHSKIAWGIS